MRIQHFSQIVALVQLEENEFITSYEGFSIVVVYRTADRNLLVMYGDVIRITELNLGQPPRGGGWIMTGNGISTEGIYWTRDEAEAVAQRLANTPD